MSYFWKIDLNVGDCDHVSRDYYYAKTNLALTNYKTKSISFNPDIMFEVKMMKN